jgi:hypothetical protein
MRALCPHAPYSINIFLLLANSLSNINNELTKSKTLNLVKNKSEILVKINCIICCVSKKLFELQR